MELGEAIDSRLGREEIIIKMEEVKNMKNKISIPKKMVKGATSGAIPGVVVGLLTFPGNYYLLGISHAHEIALALGRSSYAPSIEGLIVNSINTAIVLTICGTLYGLFYEKLPGNNPFYKALHFGLAVFIISRIGDMIRDYPISHGLVLDNILFSTPLLLFFYSYVLGKLYTRPNEC